MAFVFAGFAVGRLLGSQCLHHTPDRAFPSFSVLLA
jgi:hypothetical protein